MVASVTLEMTFDPQGERLDAALDCEATVFFETYGNTREQWHEEYGPYDRASTFLSISESGGDVIAVCRLIMPGAAGLKSLDDMSREPWLVDGYRSARSVGVEMATTMDIATIAVRKGLRGPSRVASMAIYYGMLMATRVNNLPNVVMIMDERARRLSSSIGFITQALPGTEPGPYLGSPKSTPLWANVPKMIDNQRHLNPDGFRLVSEGVGLSAIALPSRSDFLLRDRTPLVVTV